MKFIHSLQSEWLKTKRSSASWLSLIGGFFVPVIVFCASIHDHESLNSAHEGQFVWHNYFMQSWQNMVAFLLPMGLTMSISLIAQLEYKNNAWKQLYATPQSYGTIFLAKFSVIILMTLQFFIFFNIGILLSGIIPCLLFEGHLPEQSIPFMFFLKGNIKFFITSLPILALQYLISLKFKNFLVPIGVGFLGLFGTAIAFSWKYIYFSPFSYGLLSMTHKKKEDLGLNIYLLSFCSFLLIMAINYFLYIKKKEKG